MDEFDNARARVAAGASSVCASSAGVSGVVEAAVGVTARISQMAAPTKEGRRTCVTPAGTATPLALASTTRGELIREDDDVRGSDDGT